MMFVYFSALPFPLHLGITCDFVLYTWFHVVEASTTWFAQKNLNPGSDMQTIKNVMTTWDPYCIESMHSQLWESIPCKDY